MERNLAERIVAEVAKRFDDEFLTVLEAMNMTKVMTDGRDIYAIGKGDVTVVAWIQKDGYLVVKVQCW